MSGNIYVPEPIMQLVRDAREFADRDNGLNWQGRVRELADALEAEHKRADELEAIVNDGGNQAAKYWTRLTAAERALEAERANVKRAQAKAWDEGAQWAAVECGAIRDEQVAWVTPDDNPYIENEGERA